MAGSPEVLQDMIDRLATDSEAADGEEDQPAASGDDAEIQAGQAVCDAAVEVSAAALQAGPAPGLDVELAAATCEGSRYTGCGRLNSQQPADVSIAVGAEKWEQLLLNVNSQRMEVNQVAARSGPRMPHGRRGRIAERIRGGRDFDVVAVAGSWDELAMVLLNGPKLRAAKQLDRLISIALAKAAESPQQAFVGWTEQGLPVYVWRAIMLRLCDPEGLRYDPRHVPDADVGGYAASTTLAYLMSAIKALHVVRNMQVNAAVAAALRRECVTMLVQRYPHIVRKARPVDCVMLRDVVDGVDAVWLPQLSLRSGAWLGQVGLACLRNAAMLLVLGKVGRRLKHTALLQWEHFHFSPVDLGSGNFAIALQLRFPLGKGALQSHQDVPLMSKVYNWEEQDAETNSKMRYDAVMMSLLLAMMSNVASATGWDSVLRDPKLEPLRGQFGAFAHLGKEGMPDASARLQDARIIVSSCLHAAGYPGCTGHGEFATPTTSGNLGLIPTLHQRATSQSHHKQVHKQVHKQLL